MNAGTKCRTFLQCLVRGRVGSLVRLDSRSALGCQASDKLRVAETGCDDLRVQGRFLPNGRLIPI